MSNFDKVCECGTELQSCETCTEPKSFKVFLTEKAAKELAFKMLDEGMEEDKDFTFEQFGDDLCKLTGPWTWMFPQG